MSKEALASLRERFDNGRAITMGELDLLIDYAERSERFKADFDAWIAELPQKLAR